MSKNQPKPNVVKRAAQTVGKHVNVKKAARTFDQIVEEEAPREQPPKADSSVVAPTPMGGLSCVVRAAELAGFTGVVVVTLAAAVVGRCRR